MPHILILMMLIVSVVATPFASDSLIEQVTQKYGKFAKNRFVMMNNTLENLRGKPLSEQLEGVNNFFNDVRYGSDAKTYGKRDYWATPWEFLGRDQGDCEDYVIAKYFALKNLGVDPSKMFFTYVKSRRFKEPHMVLTYFETPKSIPLVLDNTNFRIFPASERRDLIPIYNFNGDALKLATKTGQQGKTVQNSKTHKKWDQLLKDIEEGKL